MTKSTRPPRTRLLTMRGIDTHDREALEVQDALDAHYLAEHGHRWYLRGCVPAEVRSILRAGHAGCAPADLMRVLSSTDAHAREVAAHFPILILSAPSGNWRVHLRWPLDQTAKADTDLSPRLRRALAARTDVEFQRLLEKVGNPSAEGALGEPAPETDPPEHYARLGLPRPLQQQLDSQSIDDRHWFRDHPNLRWRTRPIQPSERPAQAYADLMGAERVWGELAGGDDCLLIVCSPDRGLRAKFAYAGIPLDPHWSPLAKCLVNSRTDREFFWHLAQVELPDGVLGPGDAA